MSSIQTLEQQRVVVLSNMQKVMGNLPGAERRGPLDIRVLEEIDLPLVIRKKITYAAEPGDRVPAYLLIPKERKEKTSACLCLHQTTPLGKAEPAGLGGAPDLRYALELAERGHVTLAPDYPHYGDYQVDPYALGYASGTMKGIWNHIRALDLLQSLPEVDADRLGCIGHSLGGHNALFVSVFDRRIRAVAVSCGFNSFFKYMGGDLTGWSGPKYMPRIAALYGKDPAKLPFDFPDILGALAPTALFVNAPLKDGNFEISGVRDCLDAAKPVYARRGVADRLVAVHPDYGHGFPPAVREQAYAFLERMMA